MAGTRINYRLFWLWRLLAALLVCAYHFSHYAPNAAEVVAWWEHMGPLLDMFFILSGFLIFDRYRERVTDRFSYVRFLVRRLCRLYPLHLVTTGFFVLVGIAVHLGLVPSHGGTARYDFGALLSNLLLIQAWGVEDSLTFNYVSWSLSAEWFAYVLFPVTLFAFVRGGLLGLLVLLALVVAGLEWTDYGQTDPRLKWTDAKLWGAYRVYADFVYGAAIAVIASKTTFRLTTLLPAWGVMAFAVTGMHWGFGPYPSFALIGLAIWLGAVAERTDPDVSGWMDPLLPVASTAFGIYMWHPVVEAFAYSLGWRFIVGPSGLVPFGLYMVVPLVITVAVAVLSARWLEIPAGRWLSSRFERWEKARNGGAMTSRSGIRTTV